MRSDGEYHIFGQTTSRKRQKRSRRLNKKFPWKCYRLNLSTYSQSLPCESKFTQCKILKALSWRYLYWKCKGNSRFATFTQLYAHAYLLYPSLMSMPMTKDSTTTADCSLKEHHQSMRTPRISTLNLIRQFSRAYVAVSGISLNQMICNWQKTNTGSSEKPTRHIGVSRSLLMADNLAIPPFSSLGKSFNSFIEKV